MNAWKNIIATLAVLFAMNGTAGKIIKQNRPVKNGSDIQRYEPIRIEKLPQPQEHSPICENGGGGTAG